jgi:long-chain acyl-CoA synthetase
MTATAEPAASTASLPALLLEHARERPDAVALREKHRGRWREFTWSEYALRVARTAHGLRALGVEPGDRVAVHAENRPEWLVADLAIQGIGAITVGVYPTSPPAEVEYLLEHSGCVVLIAEDEEQLDKALAVRERLPDLRHIAVIDPRNVKQDISTFTELEAGERSPRGRGSLAGSPGGRSPQGELADYERAVGQLDPDATAVIVYTSGTTGPPKGAMLSHRNLHWAASRFREAFGTTADDEVLSYLPLCHVAERLSSSMNATATGYVVNFGEGGESFPQDLRDVQPTIFGGVPRVWEKMLATVEIRMADASRTKRALYRYAVREGRRLAPKRMKGPLSPPDRVRAALASALALRSVREKLGLSRTRIAVCGAAPIAPQVLEWFWALGIPVYEIYGQTENTAICTFMPAGDVRIGTVGKPLPDVELKIADDGEIVTRSPAVFLGYFRNDEATADTVDADGWLHTGDVGVIDEQGHLTITDRKKDIIITAGGKNVSPSEIENKLKVSPYVREAMVVGDRRKYLVALIGVELDTVSDWAARRNVAFTTYGDLARKPEVKELIEGVVDGANAELAQVEQIKKFALLEKELDHEDGELTATMKVKRRAMEKQLAPMIDVLYGGSEVPRHDQDAGPDAPRR